MVELFFILAFVVVFLCIFLANKNKEAEKKEPMVKEMDTSIHYSDDFKEEKTVTKKDPNHTINTIYLSEEKSYTWVCPACETENLPSQKKCCVCYCGKE